MKNVHVLKPAGQYLIKLFLLSALAPCGISAIIIGSTRELGSEVSVIGLCFAGALTMFAMYMTSLYFSSIRYEIHADEVIVRSGILTRIVKHVPFRTITNITVTRGVLDQILGIGSLSIQTAGSGGPLPEERLNGLLNVDEIYQYIAAELRKFRGSMSPTQSENEVVDELSTQVLLAILEELRIIRQELQQS